MEACKVMHCPTARRKSRFRKTKNRSLLKTKQFGNLKNRFHTSYAANYNASPTLFILISLSALRCVISILVDGKSLCCFAKFAVAAARDYKSL